MWLYYSMVQRSFNVSLITIFLRDCVYDLSIVIRYLSTVYRQLVHYKQVSAHCLPTVCVWFPEYKCVCPLFMYDLSIANRCPYTLCL